MQKIRKRVLPSKKELQEQESNNSNNDNDSDEDTQDIGNAGWADSISKVLNTTKPKAKKTLVLSRAKKLKPEGAADKKPVIDYDFEVVGTEDVKEEVKPELQPIKEEPEGKVIKNKALSLRVRPNWQDIERERALRKVATRGVVQLFNAVRIEQKDLQHKLELAGPLDSRKDAVLNNINKKKFLDVLMGGKRAKSEAIDNVVKKEEADSSDDDNDAAVPSGSSKKKSEWSVLRSDYMTNKKIKHWDEEEENNSVDSNGGGDDETDDEE